MAFEDLECVKIDAAKANLEWEIEDYLRRSGWEHTSATVDCCWRWFKTIKGRQYGCGTDDAFMIQNRLDRNDYADAHPEEFED